MLPALDRWVVRHLLNWVSNTPDLQKAIYSINISGVTISDTDFPEFVREQLRSHPLHGTRICFELAETEAMARQAEVANLIRQLKPEGWLFALSGIGRNPVSVDLLKRISVDYLKISGDIILNILRDPVDLAKVTAINRVARTCVSVPSRSLLTANRRSPSCVNCKWVLRKALVSRVPGCSMS